MKKLAINGLEFNIRTTKKDFMWKRARKQGSYYIDGVETSKYILAIRHRLNSRVKNIMAEMYFSKKLRGIYGNYKAIELYFSNGYLGLKFLNEPTLDCYKISSGTKRRDKIVAKILRKVTPKFYLEEELEFDINNKILVVPITLDKPLEQDDFDYQFVDVKDTIKTKFEKDVTKEQQEVMK